MKEFEALSGPDRDLVEFQVALSAASKRFFTSMSKTFSGVNPVLAELGRMDFLMKQVQAYTAVVRASIEGCAPEALQKRAEEAVAAATAPGAPALKFVE